MQEKRTSSQPVPVDFSILLLSYPFSLPVLGKFREPVMAVHDAELIELVQVKFHRVAC